MRDLQVDKVGTAAVWRSEASQLKGKLEDERKMKAALREDLRRRHLEIQRLRATAPEPPMMPRLQIEVQHLREKVGQAALEKASLESALKTAHGQLEAIAAHVCRERAAAAGAAAATMAGSAVSAPAASIHTAAPAEPAASDPFAALRACAKANGHVHKFRGVGIQLVAQIKAARVRPRPQAPLRPAQQASTGGRGSERRRSLLRVLRGCAGW